VRLDARAYTIPTDAPEADGTFAWTSTTLVLAQASEDGVTGIGWTYGSAAIGAVIRDELAEVVAPISSDDTGAAWLAMVGRLRNDGSPGMGAMALSAADNAVWDLKARRHNVSLSTLLGAARSEVPVYGSGGFTTYDHARQQHQLGSWVHDLGIPRVKIKIGESSGTRVGRDLARIAAARRTIGDSAELFVDANGAYGRKQAVRVMQRAAEHDVVWFEEPVSSDDLAGLAQVRDQVTPDVAAGEYGYQLAYFQRMVTQVDCLQADVTRCGGISELLRVAAVAAAHGLEISGHCAPNQHLAVLAAIPNLRHLEWFHDHVRIESMLFDHTADPTGGVARPARVEPGNGLVFNEKRASPYRVG
jgi:L-alanine-DL-glutamate epimerase-like enolase superfamily enzyme